MEQQIKAVLDEVEKLRGDINMLAMYIKDKEAQTEDKIKSIDEDMKSLEKDLVSKLQEIVKNSPSGKSGDVEYIKTLLSDDAKEREQRIIDNVISIINKIQVGVKK